MSEAKTSIAKKQAELAELLAWFESDDFAVDQAAAKLQRAHKLAGDIESDLNQLENEINVLAQRFDGDDA